MKTCSIELLHQTFIYDAENGILIRRRPEKDIDHEDRNKANNRITNLRLLSRSENILNSGLRSDNISGHRGVCFDASRNKWLARFDTVFIGRFNTKEEAIASLVVTTPQQKEQSSG